MTAHELSAWQERLGLSQVAAARLLNAPAQSYRNWLHGRADVPGPVERLTEYIERHGPLSAE